MVKNYVRLCHTQRPMLAQVHPKHVAHCARLGIVEFKKDHDLVFALERRQLGTGDLSGGERRQRCIVRGVRAHRRSTHELVCIVELQRK